MNVTSIVGARPQFIKLAPVAEALRTAGARHRILHTGQHYDPDMSQAFFDELGISPPAVNLAIGSGSHGKQTAEMLAGAERVLAADPPDWVLLYGDTNSTLAGAMAAVKLQLPTAHLEAGLRSRNRRMPEEHNRVLTDHACDLLLAPSQVAVRNLQAEGLGERTVHVGDVMVDLLLRVAGSSTLAPPTRLGSEYVLATIHRAENTDDPARLVQVLGALAALPSPVLLPIHPRLANRAAEGGLDLSQGALHPCSPLSYRELVAALRGCRAVVTDSGGLQKEAFVLRRPCVTMRGETEWIETVELGWNRLCPRPEDLPAVMEGFSPRETDASPYGRGDAAARVVDVLMARV